MNTLPGTPPPDTASWEIPPESEEAYAILANPVSWGERFLCNRDGSPRRYRDYQALNLLCSEEKIIHRDGRDVGKTVNLITLLLWYTFVNRGKSVFVAAPYQGQLDTIMDEVEFQLHHNDLLRDNVARSGRGRLKIKRKPYVEITFANGCMAYFRPSGPHGEVFRSLHVDLLLVDEAAWLPEDAWKALRQCLNAGGVFRIYSTPSGIRERTYFTLTQDSSWRQFHWPSWLSPEWSEQRDRDLLQFYGGRDTPGYQHEVAGEHGAPSYGAFDAVAVMRARTDIPEYRRVILRGEAFADCQGEAAIRDRIQELLNLPGGHGIYWLGGDLGYTADPTELLLFEEDEDGILSLVLRVHAEHVAYPIISEIIAFLDRVYSPRGIGIDRGGNGLAVEQELLGLDKFHANGLPGRLVGYDFGGSIAVHPKEGGEPLKKRVKEEMTRQINLALHARKLLIPAGDPEVENQLCTQTYTLGNGGMVYSKGFDHIVDAMRCALLRRAQAVESEYEPEAICPNVFPVATDPIF